LGEKKESEKMSPKYWRDALELKDHYKDNEYIGGWGVAFKTGKYTKRKVRDDQRKAC
jgi:hypothetical protein